MAEITTLFGIEIGAVRRMLADYAFHGVDPLEVSKLRRKVYDLEHELNWAQADQREAAFKENHRYVGPAPTFTGVVCRGDLKLGSACGHCERCDYYRGR